MQSLTVAMLPSKSSNPFIKKFKRSLEEQGVDFLEDHAGLLGLRWLCKHSFENVTILIHWPSSLYMENRKVLTCRAIKLVLKLSFALLARYRLVWFCHNVWPHEADKNFFTHKSIRKLLIYYSDTVIFFTEFSKGRLEQTFGKPHRWVVIPHGHYIGAHGNPVSQSKARNKLNWGNETRIVLFGKLRSYKGISLLKSVFEELKKDDIALLIAGQPDENGAQNIRDSFSDIKRAEFKFAWLSDDELVNVLCGADAVIFPFQAITNSSSVILAMSYGAICIIPKLGSLPEIIPDDAAIFYKTNSVSSLKEAVLLVAHMSDGERQSMQNKAVSVVSGFSWEKGAGDIVRSLANINAE